MIEITDIRKSFRGVHALDGVTFTARAGIVGLLGPNGAGKTTLLRLIATVLAPDSGTLRINGRDPQDADDRLQIRRRLGFMPQEPGFHRHFTTFQFVDYVAILKEWTDRDARHAEVRRVLDLVGLTDVTTRKIKALSGGMRRRVALAQALLGRPDVLVLDEPTAGLDPQQRLRFRELVSQVAENQLVILSTHQTEDVAALCEQVVVMDKGTVLFDGTAEALTGFADGKVWIAGERDPRAQLSWRTGTGEHRHIGDAPAGASIVEPTIEDAYLLVAGEAAIEEREGAA